MTVMKSFEKVFTRSLLTIVLVALSLLTACEDPVAMDYIPKPFMEALIVVGESPKDIRLFTTQPLSDSFSYSKAVIRNATMLITSAQDTIYLAYKDAPDGGLYHAIDTNQRIIPLTEYHIAVTLSNGRVLRGQTTTPIQIEWTAKSPDTIRYPGKNKELNIPAENKINWTSAGSRTEYLITMTCLDTTEYGLYLSPSTSEKNSRIRDKEFDDETPFTSEVTRSAFTTMPSPSGIFSWMGFKWFGRHHVRVYAGDKNFMNWVKQITFGQRMLNPNLGSVEGGLGYFGSASMISYDLFIMK